MNILFNFRPGRPGRDSYDCLRFTVFRFLIPFIGRFGDHTGGIIPGFFRIPGNYIGGRFHFLKQSIAYGGLVHSSSNKIFSSLLSKSLGAVVGGSIT